MTTIVDNLHLWNMALVLATSTITGIWGLVLFFRMGKGNGKRRLERAQVAEQGGQVALQAQESIPQFWKIALIVTAIDGLLQGLLGVILVLLGQRPGSGTGLYYLHYVYGAIVAFAIPVAYTYLNKDVRKAILILSIAALIIAAAGARAMMTGLGIGG